MISLLESEAAKVSLNSFAMVFVDAQTQVILHASHRLEKLFGCDAIEGELVGKPLSALLPDDAFFRAFADNPVTGTLSHTSNAKCRRKDGSEFRALVLVSGSTVRGETVLVGNVVEMPGDKES